MLVERKDDYKKKNFMHERFFKNDEIHSKKSSTYLFDEKSSENNDNLTSYKYRYNCGDVTYKIDRRISKIEENHPKDKLRFISFSKIFATEKKRKKALSHLPIREQKRRLEQRKFQLISKEKRSSKRNEYLHPMNSERRRANKRKPSLRQKILQKSTQKNSVMN